MDKMMKNSLTKQILYVVIACCLSLVSQAKTSEYQVETLITGIDIPWGMVQLPGGDFLVTDRNGDLYFADIAKQKNTKVQGLPDISVRGQGGLLDIALHPDYKNNGWLYFSYASAEGEGSGDNTAIMRAKLSAKLGNMTLVEQQLLYKASPNSTRKHHYGSRIAFDQEGFLDFSIGDRGDRDTNPQSILLDGGKVYRLYDDGRIPQDNPFAKKQGAKTAIYSYGHRNPQGMAMHPVTGELWIHEHGPKGGDEINIIAKGKNYGWPVVSYGVNYIGTKFTELTEKKGMEQPVWYWTPSIAPSGMTFVTSDKYPKLKGKLLVGSLKFGYVVAATLDDALNGNNKVESVDIIIENLARVRDIKQMADGYLYIATQDNKIVRVLAN